MYKPIDVMIKYILGALKFIVLGLISLPIIFCAWLLLTAFWEDAKRPFISDYTVMPGETFRLPKSYRISCCSNEMLSLSLAPADVGISTTFDDSANRYVNKIKVYMQGPGGGLKPSGYQPPLPEDLFQDPTVFFKDTQNIKYLGTQKHGAIDPSDYFYSESAKKYFECVRFPSDSGLANRCELIFVFNGHLGMGVYFAREYLDSAGLIINGAIKILEDAKQAATRPLKDVKE